MRRPARSDLAEARTQYPNGRPGQQRLHRLFPKGYCYRWHEPGSNDDTLPEAHDRHHRFDGSAHRGRRARSSDGFGARLPRMAHLFREVDPAARDPRDHRVLPPVARDRRGHPHRRPGRGRVAFVPTGEADPGAEHRRPRPRVRAGGARGHRGGGRARSDARHVALRDRDDAAGGARQHHGELLLLREAAAQGTLDRGVGPEVREAHRLDGGRGVRPADRGCVRAGRGCGPRVPRLAADGRPARPVPRRRGDVDVRASRPGRARAGPGGLDRDPGPNDDAPIQGPADPVRGHPPALRRADHRRRRERVVGPVGRFGHGARDPVGADLGGARRDRDGQPPLRRARAPRGGGRRPLEREAFVPAGDDGRLLPAHEAPHHRSPADHDGPGDGARPAGDALDRPDRRDPARRDDRSRARPTPSTATWTATSTR